MAENLFQITDTYTLLSTIERINEPLDYITKTFFGESMTVNTSYIAVEMRSEGRLLAPMLSHEFARGVDVNRTGSTIKYYSPLIFAPRRVISLANVTGRLFGDVPNLYSQTPMEQKAAQIQAADLVDLLRLHANRKEQLAAQILQTGGITLKGYADDGTVAEPVEINFGWDGRIVPQIDWDDPSAKIYDDLFAASERIQRRVGEIPTYAICGRNIERYLLDNKEIHDWLLTPNPSNFAMASAAPTWTSPQVRYIGRISALNMDFVSYNRTYIDDDGDTKPFVDDDSVIISCGNVGKVIHAPVPLFLDGKWQSIAAEYVPRYTVDENSMTTALAVYSKYVVVPMDTSFWVCIKAKGN